MTGPTRGWQPISTPAAPSPRGAAYRVGTVVGDLVFAAGLGPLDPTGEIVGTEVGEQTRQVLRNSSAVPAEHGCTLADVAEVTAHLHNGDADWAAYNAAYLEFFTPPYPARTTSGSDLGEILVEIDVVGVWPGRQPGQTAGGG